MPLVRIDAPSADADRLTALGAAVHNAHYLGVDRDDGIAFVQVFLRTRRDDEQKQDFSRALAANAAALGMDRRNLLVVLTENTLADWSFGNGLAQYLENAS
jgi:hypothetical protein